MRCDLSDRITTRISARHVAEFEDRRIAALKRSRPRCFLFLPISLGVVALAGVLIGFVGLPPQGRHRRCAARDYWPVGLGLLADRDIQDVDQD